MMKLLFLCFWLVEAKIEVLLTGTNCSPKLNLRLGQRGIFHELAREVSHDDKLRLVVLSFNSVSLMSVRPEIRALKMSFDRVNCIYGSSAL